MQNFKNKTQLKFENEKQTETKNKFNYFAKIVSINSIVGPTSATFLGGKRGTTKGNT